MEGPWGGWVGSGVLVPSDLCSTVLCQGLMPPCPTLPGLLLQMLVLRRGLAEAVGVGLANLLGSFE